MMTSALTGAPNIGPLLADALTRIDVQDLQTLIARGAVPVWEQLRAAGLFDCMHSLLALDGAIRGVRWTALDAAIRAKLPERAGGRPR